MAGSGLSLPRLLRLLRFLAPRDALSFLRRDALAGYAVLLDKELRELEHLTRRRGKLHLLHPHVPVADAPAVEVAHRLDVRSASSKGPQPRALQTMNFVHCSG